jgi:hypothetical protein
MADVPEMVQTCRRRAREASNYVWTRTKGIPPVVLAPLGIFCLMVAVIYAFSFEVLGPQGILESLTFVKSSEPPATIAFVWSMVVIVPLFLIVAILAAAERRIGVGKPGVRVVTCLGGGRDYTWVGLQPWSARPSGKWTMLAGLAARSSWLTMFYGSATPHDILRFERSGTRDSRPSER